jgi:acetyl-CoA synthetase
MLVYQDEPAFRQVRRHIGAFAAPDVVHWAPGLPKTRSGKIMRRLLRKIAMGQFDQLGDISTLADPAIMEALMKRPKFSTLRAKL